MFHSLPLETKTIGMFKAPDEQELKPAVPKRDRTDVSYNM
jgi:hypothetical protein